MKLMDQLRTALRIRHYSIATERNYCIWVRRFILFHNKRHPKDMASHEIIQFLSHLAVNRNVSASTQNQALYAMKFTHCFPIFRETIKPLPCCFTALDYGKWKRYDYV